MAHDLITINRRQQAVTTSAPWQPPSLGGRLSELVHQAEPLPGDLPALSDREIADARQALTVYAAAPAGSTADEVDAVMARLTVAYPANKLSEVENDARLDLYAEQLADIAPDVLMAGAMAAVRSSKFFPSIAELREFAARAPAVPRQRQQFRLRSLVEGQAALPAPVDYVSPDEAAAIVGEFKIGSRAEPVAAPRRAEAVPYSTPKLEPHQIRIPNKDDIQRLFGIDPDAELAKAEQRERIEQAYDTHHLRDALDLHQRLHGAEPIRRAA